MFPLFLSHKALKIHISKQTKELLEMDDHQYVIEPRDQKVELKVDLIMHFSFTQIFKIEKGFSPCI